MKTEREHGGLSGGMNFYFISGLLSTAAVIGIVKSAFQKGKVLAAKGVSVGLVCQPVLQEHFEMLL